MKKQLTQSFFCRRNIQILKKHTCNEAHAVIKKTHKTHCSRDHVQKHEFLPKDSVLIANPESFG